MELAGYLAMMMMGVMLSLLGGGGSVLTVPVLVYLFKLPADRATSYSLFLVGMTAAIGAVQYIRLKQVDFRVGFIFSIPAFAGVFIVRRYGVPNIPAHIDLALISLSKDQFIMAIFALLMLFASLAMIRKSPQPKESSGTKTYHFPLIFVEGLVVGGLTGLVGAGGGFMMIPALVLLAKLPMKTAVGTSLLIIAVKSLPGFLIEPDILGADWPLLGLLSLCTVAGILLGGMVSKKINSEQLKPAFGYLVLLMGGIILIQQSFS